MLIRDRTLGAALAASLGEQTTATDARARIHRGGGDVAAGGVPAVYTEVNARLQGDALRLGEPVYLSSGEAAASTATNNGQLNRSWDMWAAQVAG